MTNIVSLIPDALKQEIVDHLVDFLVNQAEKLAGDKVAGTLKKFSSQAEFNRSVNLAIQKGLDRFINEYTEQDEDLVEEIGKEPSLWQAEDVQQAIVNLVKNPGSYDPAQREVILCHFNEILPNRKNRKRVDQAVSYMLYCIAQELWSMPGTKEIRDVYSLQFQRITAEAAKQQVLLAQQQIQAMSQLGIEFRQAIAQLTSALETKLLSSSDAPTLARPKPYHNLPRPDYSNFVGREAELAWLRKCLSSKDRAWLVSIEGIGGVGKTSLALKIAHDYCEQYDLIPPEDRFEAIIWISAKEEVLTAEGKQQYTLPETVLKNLEDVFTTIALALDREDISMSATPEEQERLVIRALSEQRTLIIMDNLESVKDERVKTFLRYHLPDPTKAIITTREWIDVADRKELKGLDLSEAISMLNDEASNRQVELNSDQMERIYNLTSGLPLPMRLAVARMSGGESFEAVERWLGDATGELPEYCIAGQIEYAKCKNRNAWELLLACSLFDRAAGASRDALGYITDTSIVDRDSGITRLLRLFLINRNKQDRFWVLPIVQRYANEQFIGQSMNSAIVRRWIEWMLNYAEIYGIARNWDIDSYPEIGEEFPNLITAIRYCYEQQEWNRLIELVQGTWGYTYRKGLFKELEEMAGLAYKAAETIQNIEMLGKIALQRVRVANISHFTYNENDLKNLALAKEVAFECGNIGDLAQVMAVEIDIAHRKEDLDLAEAVALEMKTLGENTSNVYICQLATDRLCRVESWKGNYKKAHIWLDESEELAKKLNSKRLSAGIKFRRGTIFLREKQCNEAEKFLSEALQVFMEIGDRRYIIYVQNRLARLYWELKRTDLARKMACDNLELSKRMGLDREVFEMEKIIASINSNNTFQS